MEKDNEIKLLFTNKYSLSDRVLNQLMNQIEEKYNFEVECYETESGYIFKDSRYKIPVGELRFNKYGGEYEHLEMYAGAVEEVKYREEQDRRREVAELRARREAERKRRYKLQVGKFIATGLAITVAGTAALISMGVIDTPFTKHEPTVSATDITVTENKALNTFDSCNDCILIEWLNYAMGQVDNICGGSEYEYLETLRQEVYQNYFAPAMSAYYTYLDYKDADLPLSTDYGDIDVTKRAHDNFRNRADEFKRYLENSPYFNKITFGTTPLANAIVTDQNGNILEHSTKIRGELVSVDGEPINAVENEAIVNIRVNDLENSPYTINNLPSDVKIINGELYVSSKHMYEDYGSKTK